MILRIRLCDSLVIFQLVWLHILLLFLLLSLTCWHVGFAELHEITARQRETNGFKFSISIVGFEIEN